MTKEQLENYELTHCHAGNGYAWLADIDSIHCRTIDAYPMNGSKTRQAYLAAWSKLSPGKNPLNPEIIEELAPLRKGVKEGTLKVVNTRLVKA